MTTSPPTRWCALGVDIGEDLVRLLCSANAATEPIPRAGGWRVFRKARSWIFNAISMWDSDRQCHRHGGAPMIMQNMMDVVDRACGRATPPVLFVRGSRRKAFPKALTP
ncbi:MAG: hypothetical protein U1E25_12350 [Methylocystis sp.]